VHVVDDALAKGSDSIAEKVEADGYIFFSRTESECLQQNDGNADNAEEGSDWGVTQVASRMQTFNDNLEDIAGRIDDFVDVMSIIGVPLGESAKGDGVAIVGIRRDSVCGAHSVRLSVRLHGRVVGASFYNGLESE
jgi:hypothetical protein